MNYQEHLEKLIADIRNKVFTDEEMKESLKVVNRNYDRVLKQLDELNETLKLNSLKLDDPVITNSQFLKLMGISIKTAQTWRDQKVINFSQVNNKIFYRKSDIIDMLNKYYVKSSNKR